MWCKALLNNHQSAGGGQDGGLSSRRYLLTPVD